MRADKDIVIRKFRCCGEIMVVIKMKNATHVMTEDEWKLVYGILYPERCKDNRRTA